MLSPFEATIIGILVEGSISRYDVMKIIQNQNLYWAGSAGAVYSAVDRLFEKGLLRVQESTDPKIYEVTDLGLEKGFNFLKTVVPAEKLIMEPFLVRLRIRGLQTLSRADRINYYHAQLEEYAIAKKLVRDRDKGFTGKDIIKRLSDLAITQLSLEEEFINILLGEELEKEN